VKTRKESMLTNWTPVPSAPSLCWK